MDVLKAYPIRKSKKQKQAFRSSAQAYLESLGYTTSVEKGSLGARNLLAGDPETAKYLITAHYDTPAGMPMPNLITPCNFIAFLGYQLFLTAVIMLACVAVCVPVYLLTQEFEAAFLAWYFALILFLVLLMVGPANKNNANDNTSGVVGVLEMARSLPAEQRDKVCFVLFDLEEAGLLGSSSYRSKHKKASQNQLVLNLDCVGDGDHIRFFPSGKVKKNAAMMDALETCCGNFGEKDVQVRRKGFSVYPSDQGNFPYGVGICALHKSVFGLYLGRIHTKRDTILEETNINILRAGIISMICRDR